MACACCERWVCYQCCCSDGSTARTSLQMRIETTARFSAPAFETLQGTYTLSLDPYAPRTEPSLTDVRPNLTCVRYSVSGGDAPAGCRGAFSGLSKYICLLTDRRGFYWMFLGWSGLDNQGRCAWIASGTVFPNALVHCNSANTGLADSGLTVPFFLDSGTPAGLMFFDVYIF
jgi:hypothetical protein